jgi:hypothetical protein
MKMLPATGGRPERPKILPRDRSKRYELASALDDETKPSLLTSGVGQRSNAVHWKLGLMSALGHKRTFALQ